MWLTPLSEPTAAALSLRFIGEAEGPRVEGCFSLISLDQFSLAWCKQKPLGVRHGVKLRRFPCSPLLSEQASLRPKSGHLW